jgi:L-2-hydroxyglutarate oxidase LhgO
MNSVDYDYLVIGAGAVGLAVAAELSARGSVLVVEAKERAGTGTSSRNSEVVHAGIYYPVGSLKARLCMAGRKIIEELAAAGEIEYKKIGKLIVAVNEGERKPLNELYENARSCGVEELERLSGDEVKRLEPNVKAVEGVFSHATGILSAHSLMNYYQKKAKQAGADFLFGSPVEAIERKNVFYKVIVNDLGKNQSEVTSQFVINCGGLYADVVLSKAGIDADRIGVSQVWSKGYYYQAVGLPNTIMSHLVYPVPTRPITFLGVHATIDLGGSIKFGPTAEPMNDRVEDYSLQEKCPQQVVDDIARYLPCIRDYTLEPIMAGIRAKLNRPGQAHVDFDIRECSEIGLPGFVNLCGIESPGLTASPAIGKYVAGLVGKRDEG